MSSFQKQLTANCAGTAYRDANDTPANLSRVVEFVMPNPPWRQFSLIFPVLGHLSGCDDLRWLTCIGPQFITKRECLQFGINRQRLLQVLPSSRCDLADITERALVAGKSHAVIALLESASPEILARLQRAAELGNCRCIIVRSH